MQHLKTRFVFLAVFISAAAFGQSIDQNKLRGHWISMEDEKYALVFDTTHQREYYEDTLLNTYTYKLKGNTLVLTDKQTAAVYNYSVIDLTATRLTLLYQDRGNLLRFNKSPHRYRKAFDAVSVN